MLTALSALVSAACVLASARSLALAVMLTALDPRILLEALRGEGRVDWTKLCGSIRARDGATWESELLVAMTAADELSRVALVNEHLRELDWRAQRWARVPRVCASVATSSAFLFACVALMNGLAPPAYEPGSALVPALNALAVGIAGTAFCAAVHVHAKRVARNRLTATDRLVEQLEGLAADASRPSPETHLRVPLDG
jgi:hypothetical protein